MKIYHIIVSISIIIFPLEYTFGQKLNLSLKEAIKRADRLSYSAFVAENNLLLKELDSLDYKFSKYPKLSFSTTPISYRHSISEEFNSISQKYEPVDLKSLRNSGSFIVSQQIPLTGGSISIASSLQKFTTYNSESKSYTYTAVPMNLIYKQKLSSFIQIKFDKHVQLLSNELSNKQYLENKADIALNTVEYFFDLLIKQINFSIATNQKHNADTLYLFGIKRDEMGRIMKNDLLKLELNKINASINLKKAMLEKEKSNMSLCQHLGIPLSSQIKCSSYQEISHLQIDPDIALDIALKNNSSLKELEKSIIEAEQSIALVKASRFDIELSAGIGFNNSNLHLNSVYDNLSRKDNVNFGLNLPLVDWGEQNRKLKRAQIKELHIKREKEYQINIITLSLYNYIKQYNLTLNTVRSAIKANQIAKNAFDATKQQFIYGKANVFEINESNQDMIDASNTYIQALYEYWHYYYIIQKICLYDFEKQCNLTTQYKE